MNKLYYIVVVLGKVGNAMNPVLLSVGVLCGLLLASCAGQQLGRDSSTVLSAPHVLPHCAEDRRPSYRVLEMPPIANHGDAPQLYLDALYEATREQVKKRNVWQVVTERDTVEDVVVFYVSILSWKEDPDVPDEKRQMEMKLSLVDKLLGCEINETTGQGQVMVDASGNGIENSVADVADGAGWFVENVLIHNQYN